MGEVAEMFDVNQSLLRHWESQFPELKPHRNKKGNRLFTHKDVENLKLIYHLVKERGMTLEGARKALRQHKGDGAVSRDAELMERLKTIRALLEEVREELRVEDDEVDPDRAVERGMEAVDEQTRLAGRMARRPKRDASEEEAQDKELFAFYEQSLF